MADPVHILVVDDDPDVRALLRKGLENEGFTVAEAWSRDTIFQVLDDPRIRLLTLDLQMRSSDGLVLIREVRARRNRSNHHNFRTMRLR